MTELLIPPLLQLGVTGVALIGLAIAVRVLYKRNTQLNDRLMDMTKEQSALNQKFIDIAERNGEVVKELKDLLMNSLARSRDRE